ncbi:hypothetical protein U1Q18_002563 [Sarracenia purpurea var. burkii]
MCYDLPFPPPYMNLSESLKKQSLKGVNYASAGCGLLSDTKPPGKREKERERRCYQRWCWVVHGGPERKTTQRSCDGGEPKMDRRCRRRWTEGVTGAEDGGSEFGGSSRKKIRGVMAWIMP